MKKIAVIGANGYIGRHISYYLQKKGYDVCCYDIIGENCIQIDLTNRTSVKTVDFNVDVVFMLTGLTGTYAGFEKYETYLKINEIALLNLLDTITKTKYRPRIIFPSSRLVYKGAEHPLSENDKKETKTIYAVNKLACEGYLYAYANSFGIPFKICRICVPFGNLLSDDYSFGTLGFMISQAKTKQEITLYGDGNVKRTFTSMGDLCWQMTELALSEKGVNEVFNIGGVPHSLKDAAEVVARKYNAKIKFIEYPQRDLLIESGSTIFDSTRIEKLLGFKRYEDINSILQ